MARHPILQCFTRAALAALCFIAMSAAAYAQPALFSPVTSAAESGANTDLVARIAARPTTKSLDLVRVNPNALQSERVTFSLRAGDGVANKQETEIRGIDDYTWTGTMSGGGRVILVVMNGEITGQIRNGFDQYGIQPVGNGVHAVIQVDGRKFGPDEPTSNGAIQLNSIDNVPADSQRGPDQRADGRVEIDELASYTTGAKAAFKDGSMMGLDPTVQIVECRE